MAKNQLKKDSRLDNSLKLIVKSSAFVFLGLILARLLSYVYRVIIARYYGPSEYGLFSLALMIFSLVVVIASLGLNEGIIRYIAIYRGKNETDKIRYIMKATLLILTVSSVLFTFALFAASDIISVKIFHNIALSNYLKLFSMIILISVVGNVFINILRAFEKIEIYSFLNNILGNIIRVILILSLIFIGLKSSAIIASYLFSIAGVSLAAYLFCRNKLPEIFIKSELKKKDEKPILKELFQYSWPIIFASIIGGLFTWTDSFVLGYFKSATDVGYYNVAIPLAALFIIAAEIFTQLFFPMMTCEFYKKRYDLIRESSKQITKWVFLINLPLLLLILIFPGVIINILFGADYLIAQNALRILSIGSFCVALSSVSISLLSMLGKSKIALINTVVCSVINLILDILLVPAYGLTGAAIATTFSTILLVCIFIIQVKYFLNILPFRRKMISIGAVSIIPLVLLLVTRRFVPINIFTLCLLGAGFILTYIILIFLTGCLDKNDWLIINALKNKIFKNPVK